LDGPTEPKRQLSLFSEERAQTTPTKPRVTAPKKDLRSRKSAKISFHLADLPEEKRHIPSDLKTLRELRNWSLEDVNQLTKIPVKHLVALEAGNRTFLPAINVRAFLRTLAKEYEVPWESLLPPEGENQLQLDIKSLDEVVNDESDTAEQHWAAPMIDSYLHLRKWFRNLGKKRDKFS